ncbi:MAG TPA: universal stress protein [Arthrobacter sp.]|nr:universal stress protein [Arthrobacter sp.]
MAIPEHCPVTAPDLSGLKPLKASHPRLEAGTIKPDHLVNTHLPASVILDAARDADFSVVGSLGHAGLPGLHLGSVSTRALNHAQCPVLVVHSMAGLVASGGEAGDSTSGGISRTCALTRSGPWPGSPGTPPDRNQPHCRRATSHQVAVLGSFRR